MSALNDTSDLPDIEAFPVFQKTLFGSLHCSGVGLHSGRPVKMTLHPAKAGSGIVFRRSDLGNIDVPARYHHVAQSKLCSLIQDDKGNKIVTIEHLMAAFAGLNIDNAIVELDGPEIPIMDGSAEPFIFLMRTAGIKEISTPRHYLKILRSVRVEKNDAWCLLEPDKTFSINFDIDFSASAVGKQSYHLVVSPKAFQTEIASARTYGFLETANKLHAEGLALGASDRNTIIIDGNKILNQEGLRFKDEFVRHKILDTIGDLYLAGGPIIGRFRGFKSGHAMTNLLLKKLFTDHKNYQWVDAWGIPSVLASSRYGAGAKSIDFS